jgi:hypothetical protein
MNEVGPTKKKKKQPLLSDDKENAACNSKESSGKKTDGDPPPKVNLSPFVDLSVTSGEDFTDDDTVNGGCSAGSLAESRRSLPQRRQFQCDAKSGGVGCTTLGLCSLAAKVSTRDGGGVTVELRCQDHGFDDGVEGKKVTSAEFNRFMVGGSSQSGKRWLDWCAQSGCEATGVN